MGKEIGGANFYIDCDDEVFVLKQIKPKNEFGLNMENHHKKYDELIKDLEANKPLDSNQSKQFTKVVQFSDVEIGKTFQGTSLGEICDFIKTGERKAKNQNGVEFVANMSSYVFICDDGIIKNSPPVEPFYFGQLKPYPQKQQDMGFPMFDKDIADKITEMGQNMIKLLEETKMEVIAKIDATQLTIRDFIKNNKKD